MMCIKYTSYTYEKYVISEAGPFQVFSIRLNSPKVVNSLKWFGRPFHNFGPIYERDRKPCVIFLRLGSIMILGSRMEYGESLISNSSFRVGGFSPCRDLNTVRAI